jgi:hypothetical protein
LLILQGQSGCDRIAVNGRLPATLASLSAEFEAVQGDKVQGNKALESLLALTQNDPRLSAAILGILKSFATDTATTAPSQEEEECSTTTLKTFEGESESSGDIVLLSVSRFRDGPNAG